MKSTRKRESVNPAMFPPYLVDAVKDTLEVNLENETLQTLLVAVNRQNFYKEGLSSAQLHLHIVRCILVLQKFTSLSIQTRKLG